MRAVAFELVARPRQAVRARIEPVRPEIGRPRQPRRDGWAEVAGERVDLAGALLFDLRLDQPLHREAGLVRVRLRVPRRRRVAGVDAAREVGEADVRIADLERAGDVAELADEAIGVGV